MTTFRKNIGLLPATASLLALASGCVSRDQIMLCDPNPFHVDCKTSCVAALDPACQGFHPTRWTPLDPNCNLGSFGQPPTDFQHGLPTGEPTPAPMFPPEMSPSAMFEGDHSVLDREHSAEVMLPPPEEPEDSVALTSEKGDRESAEVQPAAVVSERPSLPSSAAVAAILQEFPAKLDLEIAPDSPSVVTFATDAEVAEAPAAEVVTTKRSVPPEIVLQSFQKPSAESEQRTHDANLTAAEKPMASPPQDTDADAPRSSVRGAVAAAPALKPTPGRPRLGSSVSKLRR